MKYWLAYLIVGTLLLGGLIVSALYSPVWYDDAGHFLVATEVANGSGMCYPLGVVDLDSCDHDSPFITMGPFLTYPIGTLMGLFGSTMLNARILMVLLSLVAIWGFFRLARGLTSELKALIAVAIMALNIQFLTYGAEVLGEVPMMGLILAGLGCFLRWDRGEGLKWAAWGIVLWCMAVGIKEYAILPTGLSLGILFLIRLLSKKDAARVVVLTGTYTLALILTLMLLHDGLRGLVTHLQARESYGSEFLAFNLGISLKFLLLKPLFWLGTGAMVLKWRVKQRPEEALTLSVQAAWLIFFLLSAGYDRFGFLLLFLPAIYVAEFVPYLWKEAGRKREWAIPKRIALIMIGLLIFSQQTFWVFGNRILHPERINAAEKQVAKWLSVHDAHFFSTVDQQLIPFLEEGMRYYPTRYVPSMVHDPSLPQFFTYMEPGLYFAAGPYAFTEYQQRIDWGAMTAVDSVIVGEERWVLYRGNE